MPNITLSIPESSFGLRMTTTFMCSPPLSIVVVHPLKQYIQRALILLHDRQHYEDNSAFQLYIGGRIRYFVAYTYGE